MDLTRKKDADRNSSQRWKRGREFVRVRAHLKQKAKSFQGEVCFRNWVKVVDLKGKKEENRSQRREAEVERREQDGRRRDLEKYGEKSSSSVGGRVG